MCCDPAFTCLLAQLCGVQLDARAHRACDGGGLDELSLGCGRLGLDNSFQKGHVVFLQFLRSERSLADRCVDNVLLVQTVLDFTCLDLGQSRGNVHGDGTGLGAGHETLGAEQLTETSDDAHHVGGRDDYVEIEPVFGSDLVCQLLCADIVSTGCFRFVGLIALREYENSLGLTGSVGEHDSAADLLVCVAAVYAQSEMSLDGLVEFCSSDLAQDLERFVDIVLRGLVILLDST